MSTGPSRRRYRVHPGVAIAAIVCVTTLAVAAEHFNPQEGEAWKILAASIICWILGVKLRHILPVT